MENVLCICPRMCDCQNPASKSGAALVSEHCPEHNFVHGFPAPEPYPDCPAEKHWWEEE